MRIQTLGEAMIHTTQAALIVIGNEILSGRTQDTNTSWLAGALNEAGISLAEVRVVPDIEAEIVAAVNALRARYDYVFTTGGIGPTHDDITAQSIANAFGVALEKNTQAYQMLVDYYGDPTEVTPARAKMAMIPVGAALVSNPVSGAPGFRLENVYTFAGVPRIMQGMFDSIRAELQGGKPVMSGTVACDLAESVIAAGLSGIQEKWPEVDIGSYPTYRGGAAGLSVVARSLDEASLDRVMEEIIALVGSLGGNPLAISKDTPRAG